MSDAVVAGRVHALAPLLSMEDGRAYSVEVAAQLASSSDPWVRARTALAAGRLRDPDALPVLTSLLHDEDPEVRQTAAFASGVARFPELAKPLSGLLDDPDNQTAEAAAAALGKLGGKEAGETLVAALNSERVSVAAAWALYRPEEDTVKLALARALESRDPDLVKAAFYSLARRPRPVSLDVLRGGLLSADPEIASWAARAMGLLGDGESVLTLVRLLALENPSVKTQAFLALEKIGQTRSLPKEALERAVETVRDKQTLPGVAIAALQMLRRGGENEAVRGLLRNTVAEGGRKGAVALGSLCLLDPEWAVRTLPQLPPEVALGAAEALGSVEPSGASALLEILFASPSPRVRATALSSLPPKALDSRLDVLYRALSDPDLSVQATAADLVAGVPGDGPESKLLEPAWDAALEALLTSGEADFEVSAVDALAKKTPLPKDRIRALVKSQNPTVSDRARRILIEKLGEDPKKLPKNPVQTGRTQADYERIARQALTSRLVVDVRTGQGTFRMELLAGDAPITVDVFASLARKGFFNGLVFHRVVPDFVIQGGDPRGDGSGGPGFSIRDEINTAPYERGAAGIALSGPDTGGSQWFVTLSRQPHLDGIYTVFAWVIEGQDVLDRIEQGTVIESVSVSLGEMK